MRFARDKIHTVSWILFRISVGLRRIWYITLVIAGVILVSYSLAVSQERKRPLTIPHCRYTQEHRIQCMKDAGFIRVTGSFPRLIESWWYIRVRERSDESSASPFLAFILHPSSSSHRLRRLAMGEWMDSSDYITVSTTTATPCSLLIRAKEERG
jgi:hypothetical protein